MSLRERRIWVAASVLIAISLIAVGVAGAVVHSDLQADTRHARSNLADAQSDLVDLSSSLEHERAALLIARDDTTMADADSEARSLDIVAALDEIAKTTGERDDAELARFLTGIELQNAVAELERTGAQVALNGGQIDTLLECLDGVQKATAALASDDHGTAVGHLQAVTASCRAAEEFLSGGAPVTFPFDFPDPFVLNADGAYWGYSTNGASGDVQLIRSHDLVGWEFVGSALGSLPSWAVSNYTWAPSVLPWGSGYVMFYTAHLASTGKPCISVAVSGSPAGPFLDHSTGPLLCHEEQGGAIDPSPFVAADGTPYLVWKAEGERRGGVASIWSQELAPSATGLVGEPTLLAQADQAWEEGIIEGPSMAHEGGRYYLLFSGSRWDTPNYGIGYTVCDGPSGPCAPTSGRIMGATPQLSGPGGQEFFWADGRRYMAYHAFFANQAGHGQRRVLQTVPIALAGGAVRIG